MQTPFAYSDLKRLADAHTPLPKGFFVHDEVGDTEHSRYPLAGRHFKERWQRSRPVAPWAFAMPIVL